MDATCNISSYHTPVLLEEAIASLAIHPNGVYVDATFGGGGHSRAILEKLGSDGRLLGFDQDLDARQNAIDDPRFTFIRSNFQYIPNFMRFCGIDKADGILADLGVSSHHFDEAERGFSFRADAPLDMRMNRDSHLTAEIILNEYDENDLYRILVEGSDLTQIPRIVKAIVGSRKSNPIKTTGQLADILTPLFNPKTEKKRLAQVFQALRIRVNGEISVLSDFLENARKVLRPGGRLAVITYHSIEDRLVKNMMRTGDPDGIVEKDFFGNVETPWKIVTRTPVTPSEEEVERNPRSRSAKLRVAELK